MTDNPNFSPERSAAIRQLLIENVEAEPRRRTSHLRALLTGLIITGIVASGSTALALNRDSLFGVQPVISTPSTSEAPTPTGSPVPTVPPAPLPSAPIAVATTSIAPRDIEAQPSGAGWILELPHLGQPEMVPTILNISDDYALVSVRPENARDGTNDPSGTPPTSLSLSLVDTKNGTAVWTREWQWAVSANNFSSSATATVLGASGRLLVANSNDTSGPHEVVELATGTTIAEFEPAMENEVLESVDSIRDDSGDVLATFGTRDEQGAPLPLSYVKRLDPTDPANPVWSTPIEGTRVVAGPLLNGLGYSKMIYSQPDAGPVVAGVLDLATGNFAARTNTFDYALFTGYTVRTEASDAEGYSSRLTGLDDNGNVVWSGMDDQVRGVAEVLTPTYQPGRASWQLAGSGQFIQATDGQFSLVDGLTGESKWTVDSTDWGIELSSMPIRVVSDGQTLSISGVGSEAVSIRVDPESGENLGRAPWISNALRGMHVAYSRLDGKITATDVPTGTPLWAIDSDADGLFFAGGRLVTFEGNTIRSVG